MVCYSRPAVYAYAPNVASIGLFCRPLAAKNSNFCHILPYFGLRHLVVSPIGSSLRKLNTGAQLQTFPYPMVSKLLLYFNALMAKSGLQSDIRKHDGQTDRQNTQSFWPPQRVKTEPRVPCSNAANIGECKTWTESEFCTW